MASRPSRLYLVKRFASRDILVFDMGHEAGSVYVYELINNFSVGQVKDEYRNFVNPTNPDAVNADSADSVAHWVEKKYGSPITFDVKG